MKLALQVAFLLTSNFSNVSLTWGGILETCSFQSVKPACHFHGICFPSLPRQSGSYPPILNTPGRHFHLRLRHNGRCVSLLSRFFFFVVGPFEMGVHFKKFHTYSSRCRPHTHPFSHTVVILCSGVKV